LQLGVLLAAAAFGAEGTPAPLQQQDVFISGEGGYHTYRIPALIVTSNQTLLAFCEGRKNSRSDMGDIDLLLKRFVDGGQTWKIGGAMHPQLNECQVVELSDGEGGLLLNMRLSSDCRVLAGAAGVSCVGAGIQASV
jgi:sialidase-1